MSVKNDFAFSNHQAMVAAWEWSSPTITASWLMTPAAKTAAGVGDDPAVGGFFCAMSPAKAIYVGSRFH
jgi:hypothetical protein